MDKLIKSRRSKAQIKQLSLLKAMRKYKALGFAYKMAPIVNPMVTEGLSQRAIAERLTLDGLQTASEWEPKKRGVPLSKNAWSQTQVARLLKDIEQVKHKMKWYYIKAHQANQILLPETHPKFRESLDRHWKLNGHKRKSPLEYYQDKMNSFRFEQMHKAGECDFMTTEVIAEEYRKFTKRKYYHKAKKATILKPLKTPSSEAL